MLGAIRKAVHERREAPEFARVDKGSNVGGGSRRHRPGQLIPVRARQVNAAGVVREVAFRQVYVGVLRLYCRAVAL